LRNLN